MSDKNKKKVKRWWTGWGFNPKTRIKESAKKYKRQNEKKDIKKELDNG